MKSACILLIDDERLRTDLLTHELTAKNYRVVAASSVETAKSALQHVRPDIVLMDSKFCDLPDLVPCIRSANPSATVIAIPKDAGLPPLLNAVHSIAPVNGHAMTVLVVDDDPDVLELLSDILAGEDYTVLTAMNGHQAIQAIETNANIGAVLLDVRIPGKGGMEVLKDIGKRRPDVGVVIISGIQDREIAQQALTLGAFDYLIKPFDINRVIDILAACLSQKEYQRRSWWKRLIE